jgi:flagellar hook-length control protein FliK
VIANLMFLKSSSQTAVGVPPQVKPAAGPLSQRASFSDVLQSTDQSSARIDRKLDKTAKPSRQEAAGKPADKPKASDAKQAAEDPKSGKDQMQASPDVPTDASEEDDAAVALVPEEELGDASLVTELPVALKPVAEQGEEELPPPPTSPEQLDVQASKAGEAVQAGGGTESSRSQPAKASAQTPSQVDVQSASPVVVEPAKPDAGGDESLQSQTRQSREDSPDTAPSASSAGQGLKLDLPATPAPSTAPTAQVGPVPTASLSPVAPAVPQATAAQPLPVPEQEATQDQANVARVVRGMQGALNQQGGSVTLRLTPPELGTVRIELALMQGTVNARFHTETESVRQLLTEQLAQLRAGLERQGLNVERLVVQTQQATSTSFGQQQGGADQSPHDGRSRGEYAAPQDQRRESGQQKPQRQFEQELLDAVA